MVLRLASPRHLVVAGGSPEGSTLQFAYLHLNKPKTSGTTMDMRKPLGETRVGNTSLSDRPSLDSRSTWPSTTQKSLSKPAAILPSILRQFTPLILLCQLNQSYVLLALGGTKNRIRQVGLPVRVIPLTAWARLCPDSMKLW
jgi:hypothetical protein